MGTYGTVLVPPAVLVSLAKDTPKWAKSVEILIFENSKGTFGNFNEASGGISRPQPYKSSKTRLDFFKINI